MSAARFRVVVSVGTDHHRFDRLVDWLEQTVPGSLGREEVLLQHGSSRTSPSFTCRDFVPRGELLQLMGRADVVIGHGGPGTIMDARGAGRLPVVVPRLSHLDEVVDDHQVAFCRRLAAQGLIVSVEDCDALGDRLRSGLHDPSILGLEGVDPDGRAAEVVRYLRRVDGSTQRIPRSGVLRRLRARRDR